MKLSLLGELKRRNVFRAAVLYIGVIWALSQGAAQLLPVFHVSNWVVRWFIVAAIVGFPFWVAFAWFFELTPEGLKLESEVHPGESIARQTARKLDFAIIGVLSIAVVLLLTNTLVWHKGAGLRGERTVIPPTAKSIAVLPFENLSNDKANNYFVAGMQDLILTKLADIGELKVISRISTAGYASHPVDLKTIADQLGVANILEGSVQKAGDSVLINVQLIKARTDAHIWAKAYTRTLDNVFGVEGEVAGKVAAALKAKLAPAEKHRLATALSDDPVANDLLLRANYLFNRGYDSHNVLLIRRAIPLYRKAIAKVPDLAIARARLSHAESLLGWYGGGGEDVKELYVDARTQADRALAFAPDLADGYLAVGYSDYYGRSDYKAALKSFAAALAARPNDVEAIAARGYVMARQGKLDQAIDALKQALALDPRNLTVGATLGVYYLRSGRATKAESIFRHFLALDPDNGYLRYRYAWSIFYAGHGDAVHALAALKGDNRLGVRTARVAFLEYQHKYRPALAVVESSPEAASELARISKTMALANLHGLMGDTAKARDLWAKALPKLRAQLGAQVGDYNLADLWNSIAVAELGLGRTKEAFQAAKRSQSLAEQSPDHQRSQQVTGANAIIYARAGRADIAIPMLARALAGHGFDPIYLWNNPYLSPIRNDPGFKALLKKYAKYSPAKVPDDTSGSAGTHAGAN